MAFPYQHMGSSDVEFQGQNSLAGDLREWLRARPPALREAPLTHEIALVARQLSLHQDPADRILAATAKVLDLTLATADQSLLGLGEIRTIANR